MDNFPGFDAAMKAHHRSAAIDDFARQVGLTREQVLKAISDFTRVCDQTGMSEKLRKE